jgi:APA family basic amino acid/polyamine antiporter
MAEVASQFRETGGPYLYTRVAFGRFVAIENGWLTWLSRIAAVSAVANLFVAYLSEFLPAAKEAAIRASVLVVLIGFLALVNYRGVQGGNLVSNFFTATKISLLLFFVVIGLSALLLHPSLRVNPPSIVPRASDWFEAVLLMIYSYGGFEAALIASGETHNTRRDIPFALFTAIGTATVLFIGVQYLVVHTVTNVALSTKPAVDSARQFLPHLGVQIVAAGTLISAYGYLSANMLHTPRITFAMSEGGDFPGFFGKIHSKFRTPHVSIVVFALLLTLFSIGGDFRWNAMLSSVARLFVYGSVAAALPVLRKKQPDADGFRLPFGIVFSSLALIFTGVLVTRMKRAEFIVIAITTLLALLNWLWAKTKGSAQATTR